MSKIIMRLQGFLIFLLFFVAMSEKAYANSSWVWVSYSPFKLLPLAIVITLILEWIAVFFIGKVKDLKRIIFVVTIANLVSFITPIVYRAITLAPVLGGSFFERLATSFEKGPYYLIMLGYLLLTLLLEVPVVYIFLQRQAANGRRLLFTIVAVNVVTTFLVFLIERIFTYGYFI